MEFSIYQMTILGKLLWLSVLTGIPVLKMRNFHAHSASIALSIPYKLLNLSTVPLVTIKTIKKKMNV
jgi:hypothetical protein